MLLELLHVLLVLSYECCVTGVLFPVLCYRYCVRDIVLEVLC